MATNKLTWQNLRKAVMEYANCSEQDAERFLDAFLDSTIAGLKSDKQVKIKGLGVFSLKAVAPRKSVNIATGKDFTIEGYNKLTFSPESLLKESAEKRIQKPTTEEAIKDVINDPIKKLGEQANEIVDILAQLGQSPDEKKVEKEAEVQEVTTTIEEITEEPPTNVEVVEPEASEPVATNQKVELEPNQNEDEVLPTPKKKKCKHAWICWLIGGILLAGLLGTGVYFRESIIGWWQCTRIMDRPIKKSKYHDIVVSKTPQKKSTQTTNQNFWNDCKEKCSEWYDECSEVIIGWWESVKFWDDQDEVATTKQTTMANSNCPTQRFHSVCSDFEELEYNSTPGIQPQYILEKTSEEAEEIMSTTIDDYDNIEVTDIYEEVENTVVSLASLPREYTRFIGSEIVDQDSRLAWIAYKYYGHKDLWVFIYEANRDVITNPAKIAPGQKLRIPDLDAMYLDMNNPELQELVKNLAETYL